MEKKINHNLCIMGAVAAIVCSALIFIIMQVSFTSQLKSAVRETAQTVAEIIDESGVEPSALQQKAKNGQRLTWIAADGSVLFDTAGSAENHADRAEVISALANGFGEGERVSATLQKDTYYYALRISDGTVIRVSETTDSVMSRLLSCLPFLFIALGVVIIMSALISARVTKSIMLPIEQIDVEHPLKNDCYEEFVPLLRRVDRQNKQLSSQINEMKAMRDDLSEIMSTMTEGLITVDDAGNILSINRSALSIFGQKDSFDGGKLFVGKPLLALHRDEAFMRLAKAAENRQSLTENISVNGKTYAAMLSRAAHSGSLLLLMDITDRIEAEQQRREFSANVSHELKTPLQSISGYAELLKSNMVKEADKQGFYNNIYAECQRLTALVQDIINLSRLDEGGAPLQKEAVDVYSIAKDVKDALSKKAAQKNVTLTLEGESVKVNGVPSLLNEMIYNLADNAICYNKPENGKVDITVTKDGANAVIKVADNGIGIPQQHQSRIFERFYRVDKSHSRQSGGTGLGLSIVKHAAMLHGGKIELESEENKGTIVTITIPAI